MYASLNSLQLGLISLSAPAFSPLAQTKISCSAPHISTPRHFLCAAALRLSRLPVSWLSRVKATAALRYCFFSIRPQSTVQEEQLALVSNQLIKQGDCKT